MVDRRVSEDARNRGVVSKEGLLCPDPGRGTLGKLGHPKGQGEVLGKVTRFQRKCLTVTVNLDRKALDEKGKRGSIAKLWVCSS